MKEKSQHLNRQNKDFYKYALKDINPLSTKLHLFLLHNMCSDNCLVLYLWFDDKSLTKKYLLLSWVHKLYSGSLQIKTSFAFRKSLIPLSNLAVRRTLLEQISVIPFSIPSWKFICLNVCLRVRKGPLSLTIYSTIFRIYKS